ncbi:MAG: selenocysteine-specific translation elongation factor [Candidatus Raymondbacteria bacterium RifOxyA12_full_50_37]|uniref:Selenocysteine-specific elongation factor n=1 Tax=Candidatus Raymondbacteria bacterium RIFOXYD12_FULL_49_13 TaxID=1817890 RepID=A0A1F7F820_UNCRA|nr:MAG: selenocysteine-specific translation elongation factor [Candidatus Raymondbacteria bacterium RifOxyA12_full_50_37]OGJ94356.1 MAG: selenocysteine-specific translation elongation factor [Candidatus Raymondbacteria bacterium RIFOXYA2_FULL_49_16]OGJ95298.1 MAG: selenocysteine-specific translation elongation factor [Candidatus Raymondbacteria bacterium RIFOXYC2_FULL_50_21]OGJ99815.1 MAG: selenocysteine-specific translation elongation factor [Candidatus Raymondbacteria bacterium RifOxyC12_full_
MKHLVLGTAGHIDHGKTALVKALTGIDTDTLAEEKKRGISINLGYAWFDLPDNTRLGVVDVPGHMRFIKTMLAGVAGIDFVLFVVAADDSVMPQTREHFDIVRLLGVRAGIIVINKIDLVEPARIEEVIHDVRALAAGSFLEQAPLVKVSALTSEGMDILKRVIETMARTMPDRAAAGLFRMPVDRSFSVAGFGTIVTGTVFSGAVKTNDRVIVLPQGLETEVRRIEVHKEQAAEALFGQRAALNLAQVAKSDVARGSIVCTPGYFIPTRMVDGRFARLEAGVRLKQGGHIKFHLGTNEINGRIYFFENSLVQITLAEQCVAIKGDRFIVRDQGAEHTLGGGEILDPHPLRHKRKKNVHSQDVEALIQAGPEALVLMEINKAKAHSSRSNLCARLTMEQGAVLAALNTIEERKQAVIIKTGTEWYAFGNEQFARLVQSIQPGVLEFHAQHPLVAQGADRPAIKQKCEAFFGIHLAEPLFAALWTRLTDGSVFKDVSGTCALALWEAQATERDGQLKQQVRDFFGTAHFSPPSRQEAVAQARDKRAGSVIDAMIREKELVVIEGMIFSGAALETGRALLTQYLEKNGPATVSALRQVINTSRKFAIPLLNYYEAQGVLIRQGDLRILRKKL